MANCIRKPIRHYIRHSVRSFFIMCSKHCGIQTIIQTNRALNRDFAWTRTLIRSWLKSWPSLSWHFGTALYLKLIYSRRMVKILSCNIDHKGSQHLLQQDLPGNELAELAGRMCIILDVTNIFSSSLGLISAIALRLFREQFWRILQVLFVKIPSIWYRK